MWVPIALDALHHVMSQMEIPVPSGLAVESIAKRFSVPESTVFHFSSQKRVVGNTAVTLTTQSAFKFEGKTEHSQGALHVGFILNGTLLIGTAGAQVRPFKSISTYAVASWNSVHLESAGLIRGLDIRVQKSRLDERGVRVRNDHPPLDSTGSLGHPLRHFALAIMDNAWAPGGAASLLVERTIEDLVVGLLLEGDGYVMDSEDLRLGLRVRAITQIDEQHRDRNLNPANLAAQLGVSLRHLQRAFEAGGRTVSQQIARARAESAGVLLLMSHSSGLTIADIAAKAGFSSTFELRAGLKARYDMLPSEYRAHGVAGEPPAPHHSSTATGMGLDTDAATVVGSSAKVSVEAEQNVTESISAPRCG